MKKTHYGAVALGGGLGAVCRWSVGLLLNGSFPLGTLVVNLTGCFLLVFLSRLGGAKWHWPAPVVTGITTGFLGAFTTFSTFALDTVRLFRAENPLPALTYLLLSALGGLSCALLGAWAAKKCLPKEVSHGI